MITDEMVEMACRALATSMGAIPWEEYGEENRCDVRRGIRAALEAADRAAWQDISTAPKDGTIIDVWLGDADPSDIEFYCVPGTKLASGWRWSGDRFRPVLGLDATLQMPTFVRPTHWCPLPDPPRPAVEGET